MCPEMCLISDHRDGLQYGSVLCHQEQQGGYINGELTSSPTTSQPTKHGLFPSLSSASYISMSFCHSPEWSGGEVHCIAQYIPVVPAVHGPISTRYARSLSPRLLLNSTSTTLWHSSVLTSCASLLVLHRGGTLSTPLHCSVNTVHGDFFDTGMLWLRSIAVNTDTYFMHLLLTLFIAPFLALSV